MSSLSIPAATLGDIEAPAHVAGWWTLGRGSEGLPLTGPRAWTVPGYTATRTTPKVALWRSADGGQDAPCWQPGRWDSIPEYALGAAVLLPWSSGWQPADGTDRIAIVHLIDGSRYEIQNLRQVTWLNILPLWWATGWKAKVGDFVCDQLHLVKAGEKVETHTVRGAGKVAKLDGVVTAATTSSITTAAAATITYDNLVDLIVTCLNHPAAANQTFLVSDGEEEEFLEYLLLPGRLQFQRRYHL